ncbi:LacI family DNA-binding transcriptional regulator [uncultured Sphaerochaeta sp.]|uniref:LacI family DNA-binding transcriptional regulator n=1 Tax=uncultured Sphaerochaeta sp. TaxID=886478 RepID=UPI0029C9E06F|nr:LacI family DNA-binding transcriptional regulator [uncultured Sphaerochaeta sp.]
MQTIKEISQRAGVSPTTVSNVIHGRTGKVSPEVRAKVERILEEVNYAPNMAATILAHENSRIVGVIFFSETRRDETQLEDPFSFTILGNIEWELRKLGYYMMVHTTSDQNEVLRFVQSWKLAGVIILWVPQSIIPHINEHVSCPVVHIDSYHIEGDMKHYRVGIEDRLGGYQLSKYLLSMGHREMVFLSNGPNRTVSDRMRFYGLSDGFREYGMTLEEQNFIPLPQSKEERYKIYSELSSFENASTVIVFSADYYASEAIAFFHKIGIDVPDDISVTGFDDNIFSRITSPTITTIHQDTAERGRLAVDMLIKLIEGEVVEPHQVSLPVYLQVRESVKRI